ncbi:MAG: LysR family transcriptional regulator [Treponema sp.]|nr:LysR family transcriptional regulator [Treponema sp.]
MELSQLHYFLEVAQTQHVTRSAENLHMAQPALTHAIHKLEDELEVPLFMPRGRNIMLTSYGEYFYKKLSPLLEELDALPEQLKSMANLENATVHLNVLAASSLVTEAIIEYQRIDDNIHIELKQNEQSDLYDINVTTKLFYQPPEGGHDSVFVCTEKIYLAVPNIPRFRGRDSITLQEVKDDDFIALSGSKQLRSIFDKYCTNAGIHPNIIFESDSPTAVKNMIGANMGIGFWPDFSWEKVDTHRVRLLEIANPQCSRDILITYKRNKQDNTRTKAFYTFLTKYFELASHHYS